MKLPTPLTSLLISLLQVLAWAWSGVTLYAADFVYEPVGASDKLVPLHLMKLVHAPEVQKEIGLTSESVDTFEDGLRPLDALWWPSRLLKESEQRTVLVNLEGQLTELVKSHCGKANLHRLRQIELQSQGPRVMVRKDVEKHLKIDSTQRTKLTNIFQEVDRLEKEIDWRSPDQQKVIKYQDAAKDSTLKATELLNSKQKEGLAKLFGKSFDTSKLQRTYPLAPELIETTHRFGERKVTLAEERGKVVLVHFYAFQCSNCIANFPHYKRWESELSKKGVSVIGIQTPETKEEKDPQKVIKAATREGFQFPVLIDLEGTNWNAWGNTMWPTIYVVDKRGYIRYWWQGELNWEGATGDKKIEGLIDSLLAEEY